MHLNPQQVESNWNDFLLHIEEGIEGERKDKLLAFYDKHADRFATMPASGKESFHNAFLGGYIDHVNRVHDLALDIAELWGKNNAQIDFTFEELVMVALNHDLGKFGLKEHEYYIPQTDAWAKEKKGEIYKHNPEMQFMKTSDRSLFLLQQIGVQLSQKEWLAINLHDGLYEEAARSYYISYNDDFRLRTNLPYIVHQADLAATRIEYGLAHPVK